VYKNNFRHLSSFTSTCFQHVPSRNCFLFCSSDFLEKTDSRGHFLLFSTIVIKYMLSFPFLRMYYMFRK
jgi:hypothetical protein